jgi:hypothetical protein
MSRRLALAFALVSLTAGSAHADELSTCVKASEVGQTLRDEGKYLRARENFAVCSRDVCPGIVRRDCTGWLLDVEKSLPSVVISATDGGHDITDVKVTIDGVAVAGKLEGKPISLDPGAHALHYEHGGQPALDDQIVVRAGEKNRLVKVSFGTLAPPLAPTTPPLPANKPTTVPAGKPPSPLAYVLGGVGVVGLVGWAYFGVSGDADVHNLRSTCGQLHDCSDASVSSARTKLVLADVGMGVGLAGVVAGGIVFFATRRSGPSSAQPQSDDDIGWLRHLELHPTGATFSGRF